MRRAPKLPRYPSADYARLTGGEALCYSIAGILGLDALIMAGVVATGNAPAGEIGPLVSAAVVSASVSLVLVAGVRRRHLRRRRERAELVAALEVEAR